MEKVNSSNSSSRQQCTNNSDNDSESALIPSNSTELVNNSKWRNMTTVAILCFVNLINYMDRFTLAGVLTDVQETFKIGDDMGGLIQTVFVVSYMFFAPLFGYLGDRQSRVRIMAGGIFLWSVTTLIGSFMTNFGWFVFFRALVGIGEASYSTIAPTVISDLFVKDMRSKMLALFYFAIPVGSGLGYIVGSETAKAMGSWHWGLRVTPSLGLIAVFLMLTVLKEPERGEAEGGSHVVASTYKEDIKMLGKNRSFVLSTAGFTCVAFVAGALAWWGPRYIYLGLKIQPSNASVTKSDVSLNFGVISMMSGLIGVPLGTLIGECLVKKYPRIHPIICGVGLFLSVPFMVASIIIIENKTVLPFVLVFFGELMLNLNWAIVADICLYVVMPRRRSTAEAFQILISHALGDAGSPYLIGVISESLKPHFSSGADIATNSSIANDYAQFKSLQYALFITCFVEVLGGIFFLLTALYIVKDKSLVEKEVAESSVQPTHHYAEDEPNLIT